MAIFFLALFIGLPLIEIYFLIEVGSVIGALPTIIVCITTAVLGTFMIRVQGMGALQRARSQFEQNVLPEEELFGGVFLLLAALFLLTPGFLTDAIGFLLLVPPLRRFLARAALARAAVSVKTHGARRQNESGIIDGEYVDITEPDPADDDKRSLPR